MKSLFFLPWCRRQAFTLIELLVVITIIALLAGLAVPAVMSSMEKAKRAKASSVMTLVQTGLANYRADYNIFPASLTSSNAEGDFVVGDGNNDWGEAIRTLSGFSNSPYGYVADNGTTNNRRLSSYVQFPVWAVSSNAYNQTLRGGCADVSKAVNLIDPWFHPFVMILDGNYDNHIAVPDITSSSAGATTVLYTDVAVYSMNKVTNRPKNYIASWE